MNSRFDINGDCVATTDYDLWIHRSGSDFASDYVLQAIPGSSEVRAAWSPDATMIALTTFGPGSADAEIAVMDVQVGSNTVSAGPMRPLTDNQVADFDPTWSPNSR